jgi:hypothetical protein
MNGMRSQLFRVDLHCFMIGGLIILLLRLGQFTMRLARRPTREGHRFRDQYLRYRFEWNLGTTDSATPITPVARLMQWWNALMTPRLIRI